MKRIRLLLTALLICLLLLTSCQMPFYPTASPTEKGEIPTTEDSIGSLDAELERVGITGYDAEKLANVDLCYNLYYIGGKLPNRRIIAEGVASFMSE